MGLVTVLQNRLGIILRYLILILLKLEEGLFSKVCSFLVIFYLYWALLASFFQLPAPWYSGREAGLLRDPEAVTFLWPGLLLNNNLSYIHPNDSAPRLGLQHVASMPAHKGADYGHSMLKWMKFGEESRRKIAHSGYEPMTSLLVALDLFICELLCWPNGRPMILLLLSTFTSWLLPSKLVCCQHTQKEWEPDYEIIRLIHAAEGNNGLKIDVAKRTKKRFKVFADKQKIVSFKFIFVEFRFVLCLV